MIFKQPRKKPVNFEMFEQEAVIQHLQLRHPKVLFTASAGGMRTSKGTAIKMKRMGYQRGTPDIFIEEPRNGYHGLRIEMKTAKTAWSERGVPSPEQREWVDALNQREYFAIFCYGRDHAIQVIDDYLTERK